jgi:hypothetical protein
MPPSFLRDAMMTGGIILFGNGGKFLSHALPEIFLIYNIGIKQASREKAFNRNFRLWRFFLKEPFLMPPRTF